MAVAWIGNRGAPVQDAVKHAAELLAASWCPAISINADVEGARAAIALAQRTGAAYDIFDDGSLARETAAFIDAGGMSVTPGEARRRADLVVIVGELPKSAADFVVALTENPPDLAGSATRRFFVIANGADRRSRSLMHIPKVSLSCEGTDLAGTVAALRALHAGRRAAYPVVNIEELMKAIIGARFTIFVCAGTGCHPLVLEMVQGLVSEINLKTRASVLLWPDSEAGWGTTLVSAWTTGFPPRTSFARGIAEFDPWRWNVSRMIEDGEADLHLWVSATPQREADRREEMRSIALTRTDQPAVGASITISIGEPGVDHDSVMLSDRTGTMAARNALSVSRLPASASILRAIADHVPRQAGHPC